MKNEDPILIQVLQTLKADHIVADTYMFKDPDGAKYYREVDGRLVEVDNVNCMNAAGAMNSSNVQAHN